MSEMVDRVAMALRGQKIGTKVLWTYEDLARAAIEAMREPTDAMVMATDHAGDIYDAWRDMIDEALK